MLQLLLLAIAGVLCSAVTVMASFGGGVVLIVVLLMFMPPAVAIPVHGLVQVVSNISRVYLFRQGIPVPLVWRYSLLLAPGAALGMVAFQGLSEQAIKMMIGVFALGTLLLRGSRTFGEIRFPRWSFIPLGFVVGVLSVNIGAVGVLFGTFLIRQDLSKEAVNGTNAAFSLIGHLIKVAAFGLVGFNFGAHLPILFTLWGAVVTGTLLGKRLHARISERTFVLLFNTVMAVLALRLILWEGLSALLGG